MSRRLPHVLLRSRARSLPVVAGVCLAMTVSLGLAGGPALAGGRAAEPAGINPGPPPWAGSAHPVPAPPASYDPSRDRKSVV